MWQPVLLYNKQQYRPNPWIQKLLLQFQSSYMFRPREAATIRPCVKKKKKKTVNLSQQTHDVKSMAKILLMFTLLQATKDQMGSRYSSTLSLTSELDRGGWSAPRPGRFTPGKETRYPQYRKYGRIQGRSRRVRKTSPPPGFQPRIVQPVASRYTD